MGAAFGKKVKLYFVKIYFDILRGVAFWGMGASFWEIKSETIFCEIYFK